MVLWGPVGGVQDDEETSLLRRLRRRAVGRGVVDMVRGGRVRVGIGSGIGVRAGRVLLAVVVVMLVGVVPVAAQDVPPANWQLDHLDAPAAWEVTRGEGVLIGVVDAVVDPDLPDMAGTVKEARPFTATSGDASHHGTGVVSLMVGTGANAIRGLAPGARVVVAQRDQEAREGYDYNEMMRWLVDQDADVINLSWGIRDGYGDQQIRDGIAYALEHDVVVVASAGNVPIDPGVTLPASYPGVIAVTATNPDDTFCACSVSGPETAIAAPGAQLRAADPTFDNDIVYIEGGTSASAALVSATAALVRSAHPGLDAANVVNRLLVTARDAGPAGRDDQFGFGIVDPVAAVTADVPLVDANPLLEGREGEPTGNATPIDTNPYDDLLEEIDRGEHVAAPPPSSPPSGPPWLLLGALGALVLLAVAGLWWLLRRLVFRRPQPRLPDS